MHDKETKNGSEMNCEHKDNHGHMCGMGSLHCYGRHQITHLVIKVIIILIIFWFGVKVGEMRSFFYGNGYGNFPFGNMMYRNQNFYNPNDGDWYGPGMMYRLPTSGSDEASSTTTK